MNKKLKREVWEKEKYLDFAHKGSLDVEHPGMKILLKIADKKNNILDLGCGDGTRLNLIDGGGKTLTGIDISNTAIKKAKKLYPKINFTSGNIERLPFADGRFDFVYSAFVFEHLDKPEAVIREVLRVLKKGGNLLIIAPNYGSPNRASPPFKGNRLMKLIAGFISDFFRDGTLGWQKVNPIADRDIYEMDWDATTEPYLGTLIPFLKKLKVEIIESFSCWEEEGDNPGPMQRLFRFLGERNVYPFISWGPHLVLLGEK